MRHDVEYLEKLLQVALRLHKPENREDATVLADVRDYFMWLTVDAWSDPVLAKEVVRVYMQLELLLEKIHRVLEHPNAQFYIGWLFGMEQTLSLHHSITLVSGEPIGRRDFEESWKKTSVRLGL